MIVLGLFAERQVFVQRMELMIMKSFDDSTVYGGADDIVSIIHSLRVADINQISVMIEGLHTCTGHANQCIRICAVSVLLYK